MNDRDPPLTLCQIFDKCISKENPFDYDFSMPLTKLEVFVLPPLVRSDYFIKSPTSFTRDLFHSFKTKKRNVSMRSNTNLSSGMSHNTSKKQVKSSIMDPRNKLFVSQNDL